MDQTGSATMAPPPPSFLLAFVKLTTLNSRPLEVLRSYTLFILTLPECEHLHPVREPQSLCSLLNPIILQSKLLSRSSLVTSCHI